MDAVELEHKNLIPLFLTLTIKNCADDDLAGTLDKIFQGWHNFLKHRKVKGLILGWFRALELTYKKETDEFHPHVHALIFVDKSYFENGSYLETVEWVRLWRVSLGLDYDPICDIRRIRNRKARRKGIAEVAKYTVKDADIATADKALTDRLVLILGKSLKGRRLYAFGGLLKQIAAKFSATTPDEGDLVHVGDETIRCDVATVIERYRWNFGVANYEHIEEAIGFDSSRVAADAR
jgi:hypothetical protein